ncbi:hypothetical protein [Botrimarina sp.]|uniref:hypothetical protein n=1 Tax=Botrimarina sp. TaxID=2795802 RepID=UPI0032EC0BDB
MPSQRKFTAPRRELLLRRVLLGQSITAAAEELGFSRQAVYRAAKQDPAFRSRLDTARHTGHEWRERRRPRVEDPVASLFATLHQQLSARWCNGSVSQDAETA